VLAGPIILAVIIVIVLPIAFLLTGGVIAALYSYLLPNTVDAEHEGSELISLNQ
jgi:hypothetical protein